MENFESKNVMPESNSESEEVKKLLEELEEVSKIICMKCDVN